MSDKKYNDYMAKHRNKAIPKYDGYTGKRVWKVKHPDHGEVMVIAPSRPAAIATAAGMWCRRWQEYEFYTNCSVDYLGTEVKKQ